MDDQESMVELGDEAGQAAAPDPFETDGVAPPPDDPKAGPDSGQLDNRTLWIVLGVFAAAVILAACCIIVAISAGWLALGSGGQPEPTTAPIPTQAVQPTQSVPDTPPVAAINYSPSEAAVGEGIMFDGSHSTPGSSTIASYEWAFGDGSTASGATVTHPYANPGTYGVTLTVTGEDGLSDSEGPVQVTIHEGSAPTPTEGPAPTDAPLPTDAPQPTAAPPPTDTPVPEPTAAPLPTETPVPEPTVLPPTINAFRVKPQEVSVGGCFDVSWSTGPGTSWVNVVRNDDYIWENAPQEGNIQDCPDKAGEYLYKVVAYNVVDDNVHEETTVTVSE
jgi:hypothetical protein